jgi:hypothetical protein
LADVALAAAACGRRFPFGEEAPGAASAQVEIIHGIVGAKKGLLI